MYYSNKGEFSYLGQGFVERIKAQRDLYLLASYYASSGGGNISLYFDGNRMYIIDESTGSGVYNTKGYSGRANDDGSFTYTSDKFDDRNTGPIPQGDYYINVNEIQTISARDRVLGLVHRGGWPGGTIAWGSQRAWIYPMPGTNVYGRSGFSIHGGSYPGSAGCIDLVGNVNVFFNRLQGAAGSQNQVLLRVRY